MTSTDKVQATIALMEKRALMDFGYDRRMDEYADKLSPYVTRGGNIGGDIGSLLGGLLSLRDLGGDNAKPLTTGAMRVFDSAVDTGDALKTPGKSLGNFFKQFGDVRGPKTLHRAMGRGFRPIRPLAAISAGMGLGWLGGGATGALSGLGVGRLSEGAPPEPRFIGF